MKNKEMEEAETKLRAELEEKYGKVWNTKELQEDFSVKGFLAPFVTVERKSDNKEGVLEFTHMPRFYYNLTVMKNKFRIWRY